MRDPTPAERQLAYLLEEIDVRPMKDLARRFPTSSNYRKVVAAEKDRIPRYEFLGKLIPWETLLRDEFHD